MKIKFRSSADAGGEGVIYYQITRVFSLMFRKTSFKTPENIIKARA